MKRRSVTAGATAQPDYAPVERPRVTEHLRGAARSRVALLLAPAGYGKTIALRHFLAASTPSVYYPVRDDNEALRGFLRGFAEALQVVAPGVVATLADAFAAAQTSTAPEDELARWLLANLRDYSGVLALDNFHLSAADTSTCRLLAALVERTSGNLHWIIAARDAGCLPVASWSAYRWMDKPLTESTLRFDTAEAAAVTQGALTSQQFDAIYALTRGWPIALCYAAQITRSGGDLSEITSNARDIMYGLLAEHIFARMSAHERTFLLETAVYPRVDVELLARAGYDDAAHIIRGLRERTSFLQVESDNVFRYQELFRDFLQDELQRCGAASVAAAFAQAGSALERNGDFADALTCFVSARAEAQVLRMLEAHGFDLIDCGRREAVEKALNILNTSHTSPTLIALKADFLAAAGNAPEAQAHFQRALNCATGVLQRAGLAHRFARTLLVAEPRRLREVLEPYAWSNELPPPLEAAVCSLLAVGYAGCEHDSPVGKELIERALRLGAPLQDHVLRSQISYRAGYCAYASGDIDRARGYALDAVRLAEGANQFRIATVAYYLLLAVSFDWDDNVAESDHYLARMQDCAARAGSLELSFRALWLRILFETERANHDALREINARMDGTDHSRRAPAFENMLRALALHAAWDGDFSRASTLFDGATVDIARTYWRAEQYAQRTLYLAAAGERAAALSAAAAAQSELNGPQGQIMSPKGRAQTELFCALAYLICGDAAAANHAIQRAEAVDSQLPARTRLLTAAVRTIYINTNTGLASRELAAALAELQHNEYGGYALLLEKLPLVEQRLPMFALLTDTELDILRALGQGGTSGDIAASTGRQKCTIDWHVLSIRRKMGAASRRHAVELARSNGLIRS